MAKSENNSAPFGFDRVIVVYNPLASNGERSRKRIAELRSVFGKQAVELVETPANSQEFNAQLLGIVSVKSANTLLCIGGGDGTVHDVVDALLSAKEPLDLDKITLLPLWAGNANDFAYMLNGLIIRKKIPSVLRRGHAVKIYPLQITVKHGSSTDTYYAACYASFGASAHAARRLAKVRPAAHKGRVPKPTALVLSKEFFHIVSAFSHASTYQAEMAGETTEVFEQVFTNGSRMAKIDRLPVKLSDKAFYYVRQSKKHKKMIFKALKLLAGKSVGTVSSTDQSFTIKEPVLAQFDGEVFTLPENSTVTVGISKQYVTAVSSKL